MDIFSTREVATTIWFAILFLFMFKSDAVAKSFLGVIKALGDIKLIFIFAALAVYVMLVCWALSHCMTWSIPQIKTSIFWYLFVGLALLFSTIQAKEEYNPLRSWITNTFKFLIVVEFLASTYTFPLLAELIFLAVAALVAMMAVFAKNNPEQKQVASFLNWVMVLLGFGMITYATKQLLGNTDSLDFKEMTEGLILPIILSFLTIPFFYGLYVYLAYENAFIRFQWEFPDDTLRKSAKRRARRSFGLRTKALRRWARLIQSDRPTNMDEINQSIAEAKQVEAWEKNPPPIDSNDGWSPFTANLFLSSLDVKMFDYREYDGRWHADSNFVKTKDGYSPNHINYMIEGTKLVVDTLRLKLTLNNLSTRDNDLVLFTDHIHALLSEATPDVEIGLFIQNNIGKKCTKKQFGLYKATVKKEVITVAKLVIEEYEFRLEIS